MKSTVFHQSAHMQENDLLHQNVQCPFCESTDRSPVLTLQKDPTVTLLHCNHCCALSASRMPNPDALTIYYSNYYCDQLEKVTLDEPNRIASHIVKYANPVLRLSDEKNISILDYGGGDGTISLEVASQLISFGAKKVNIHLLDYDQSTVETGNDRIHIFRSSDLSQITPSSINLVIASAVIEHIPTPRPVLLTLLEVLKPGGVFYARTPYVTPLMLTANVLHLKYDFTFPAHVHDLGAKFWNRLMSILPIQGHYEIFRSCPSIVETSFKKHFFRTLLAYILKMPGYIFKKNYGLVGGWEIFIQRHE